MTPLRVLGQLDFVDGQKIDNQIHGHGFHGANPKTNIFGDNFFLACDEGGAMLAGLRHHAVVNLPGQQPQRKTNHAGGVGEHSCHRMVRFARVGGPQDRRHMALAGDVRHLAHGGGFWVGGWRQIT